MNKKVKRICVIIMVCALLLGSTTGFRIPSVVSSDARAKKIAKKPKLVRKTSKGKVRAGKTRRVQR